MLDVIHAAPLEHHDDVPADRTTPTPSDTATLTLRQLLVIVILCFAAAAALVWAATLGVGPGVSPGN